MGTRVQNPPVAISPAEMLNLARQNTQTKFNLVRISLISLDVLIIAISFWLAEVTRFSEGFLRFFDQSAQPNDLFYQQNVYLLIPMWIILFSIFRLYDPLVLFGGHQEYMNVFNACTAGIMLAVLVTFFDPSMIIARGWLLLVWAYSVAFIGLERFTFRRVIYALRRRGHFMSPAYIVGANAEGIAIAEQLLVAPMSGINVIGFLDDNISVGEEILPGITVHGNTANAERLVNRFGIERMIVATSGIQRENLLELFKRFTNSDSVAIWLSSGIFELITTGVRVQDVGSVSMISVNRVRLTGINVIAKALLDYFGALAGLIVFSPVFLLVAYAIKREDGGPIFHRRRVVGVNGKEFDAFKFRTMVQNADKVLEELMARDPEARAEYERETKLKNDPRITKIGNLLRKTSVDELPQLANVLRGEMSLVGPRMITPREVAKYGRWGMNLQTVKPGLTGLWQVTGRSDITYEERVRLDMYYIRNYSIWLDIQIIFQTIPAVLMSKGAY